MPGSTPAPQPVYFASPAEFRAWLEAHHATEQERQFQSNPQAWTFFQTQPPWYRRAATWWVISAKREDTRQNRLATLIQHSASNTTIPALTRPAKK